VFNHYHGTEGQKTTHNVVFFFTECQYFAKAQALGGIAKLMVKSQRKRKVNERVIFEAIRKPTAPPSRKFGTDAPEEKHLPSLRKSKHKKPPEVEE